MHHVHFAHERCAALRTYTHSTAPTDMLSVLNNPVLTLQLGILGKLLGLMGRIVKGCVREVSLAQISCILMYVYVAPPTPVGA